MTMTKRAVEAALNLKRDLDLYHINKDRTVLIKAFRDQFLAMRSNAAVEIEKGRLKAIEVLIDRMPRMTDMQLLKTIQSLSEITAVDLIAATKTGPGPLVNVQQNLGISMTQGGSNPVRQTGELLEAIEHIANHFRNKTVDLKKDEYKKES